MPTREQERKDMLAYMDELERRLPRLALRAAKVLPGEELSVEWFERIGSWWRSVRETRRLSTYEAAGLAGVHVNLLRIVENGFGEPMILKVAYSNIMLGS